MAVAYIAFGSNLGERYKNIRDAISSLTSCPGIEIKKISSIIETEPEGGPRQGKFLNGAIEIETDLPPEGLLEALQKIENALGRERTVKNSPRAIDLDILFYEDRILDVANLKIPHPRLHKRLFVLGPLSEIAPDFMHPVLKKKIADLPCE